LIDIADPGNAPAFRQPPAPPPSTSPFTPPYQPAPPGAPARSASPARAPEAPGPQAWNDARPAGVLRLSRETVVRLQDADPGDAGRDRAGKGEVVRPAPAQPNSGTKTAASTPIHLSRTTTPAKSRQIPPPRSGARFAAVREPATRGVRDRSV